MPARDVDPSIVVSAWVQHLIAQRRVAESPRPVSFERIGKELGISKVHAMHIFSFKAGAGPKVEQHLARARFGGSRDALLAEANKWWDSGGQAAYHARSAPPGMGRGDDPRSRELERAIGFLRDELPDAYLDEQLHRATDGAQSNRDQWVWRLRAEYPAWRDQHERANRPKREDSPAATRDAIALVKQAKTPAAAKSRPRVLPPKGKKS